ncbi:MAG TPA: HAMP domain-containing protein [Candidatus Acidoferrales bacterium]|jgi:HAMP domain-containing protein|nr:HAMP domain-containing protein [Candidatus Acidoferrales bacterium]
MKGTIRNKLTAGFSGVLILMAIVAMIGGYAVFSLRHDANDATRVGARLNSLALEIQIHDLEASRKVNNYLAQTGTADGDKKRKMYLEEAKFEINEIQTLASKAVEIAPTSASRVKFTKIREASAQFGDAIEKVVTATDTESIAAKDAKSAYEDAADELHESAEDGEVVGHDASQASLEAIDRTSSRSVALVVGISVLGLILGITVSYKLARAILIPVDHLKEVAENVSLGNLDMSVHRYSDDEIGDLADSFSRMVTAVKFFRMEAQLGQSEEAAHEVKH